LRFVPELPEGRTPSSNNPLDQWILARLNQVISQITQNLEDSDAYSATLAFESLLDDLSNWYVRRSRRRFWKSEQDSDKSTAYITLWHVLVKMTRALAPIIPFITETMYRNLVRSVYPDAYESIHHTDWPGADHTAVNEKLIYQMDLARRIASLGLSARNNANLKVRQPLARVLVHVREGNAELPAELIEIVADELNVKALETITNLDEVVRYKVLPNNKLLGPRFGADFRRVSDLLQSLDPYQVAAKVAAGESVTFDLNGETVALTSEEILISTESLKGLVVAADKLVTVAIDTTLTPELKAEGLAREIVRRIQTQRKNADFNIEDRITTWYVASDEMARVFTDWGEYIQSETLTTELVAGEAPAEAFVEEHKVEGKEITIGLKRN
jgi:isoleucyl-tRNA synthetase